MASHHSNARTAAYYRMSDLKQDRSIEDQQTWAVGAKTRHGLDLVREFQDEGIPGDEIELRPGLQAMLAFCEEQHRIGNPIEAILAFDADRLSRAGSMRTAGIICRLHDAGVSNLVTAEGVFDFENETDRILFNIKQDAARSAYSKLLSRRVTGAAIRHAREGKWGGGRLPYAYALGDDGRLALGDPAEVEAVRWMFDTYDRTATSLIRIADELNRSEAPKPHGKAGRWTKAVVWGILTNPVYTGDLHYGRHRQGKYHTIEDGQAVPCKPVKTRRGQLKQQDKAAEHVIVARDVHPALTTREQFERVGRKLRESSLSGGRNGKRRRNLDYPLSGVLSCGDCGRRMTGITLPIGRGRKVELRQYCCTTYREAGRDKCNYNPIPEEVILPLVFEAVRQRLSDPATVEMLRSRIEAARHQLEVSDTGRAAALRKRIAELRGMVKQGNVNLTLCSPDRVHGVEATIREWEAEQAAADEELRQIEQAFSAAAEDDARIEQAMRSFADLGKLIRLAGDSPDVRNAVQAHVERVELSFRQEDHGRRRFSECTSLTVHFRPLGEILGPVSLSLDSSAWANRS